ncbi:MAG TPA: MFS transporter [Ktedonobacteraceae bacterium]|nr:MFS transporter [Ktedonobacteraceae bacterium]
MQRGPKGNNTDWWSRIRAEVRPTWSTRAVELLLAARACMSAVRALAGVIVPIYLAVIGYNGLTLGLLFTVVAFSSAILTALIGPLSDRFGRKLFIVIVPWLAAIAAVVFAFSRLEALLFLGAALGSFGRGAGAGSGSIGPYQPAEQAFLADAVPARHRNSLFGRVAFASSLGALLGSGPLVALPTLLSWLGLQNIQGAASYRFTFLVMAGIALVAGLLAVPLTEPSRALRTVPRPAPDAQERTPGRRRPWRISRQSWPILLRLWTTNSINGLAVGFFGPFITYWFYRRYGVGPVTIGFLFALINLAAMVANLGAARIAARLGLVRAIVVSRTLQAVLLIPMVLAPTFWMAGLLYLVRMLAQRVSLPLRQSYVMGVVPQAERGTVGALSNLPSQVTSAASPTVAGYLFDHVSLALPFEIGAVLQGINALLFLVFFRSLLPPEEQEIKPTRGQLDQQPVRQSHAKTPP